MARVDAGVGVGEDGSVIGADLMRMTAQFCRST
jgi:hypothetical protein